VDNNIAVMLGVANPVPKSEDSCPDLHQLQIGIPKMFQDLRCSGGMLFSFIMLIKCQNSCVFGKCSDDRPPVKLSDSARSERSEPFCR